MDAVPHGAPHTLYGVGVGDTISTVLTPILGHALGSTKTVVPAMCDTYREEDAGQRVLGLKLLCGFLHTIFSLPWAHAAQRRHLQRRRRSTYVLCGGALGAARRSILLYSTLGR